MKIMYHFRNNITTSLSLKELSNWRNFVKVNNIRLSLTLHLSLSTHTALSIDTIESRDWDIYCCGLWISHATRLFSRDARGANSDTCLFLWQDSLLRWWKVFSVPWFQSSQQLQQWRGSQTTHDIRELLIETCHPSWHHSFCRYDAYILTVL